MKITEEEHNKKTPFTLATFLYHKGVGEERYYSSSPNLIFIYVKKGDLAIDTTTRYFLKEGEGFFLSPDVIYQWVSLNEETEVTLLEIDPSFLYSESLDTGSNYFHSFFPSDKRYYAPFYKKTAKEQNIIALIEDSIKIIDDHTYGYELLVRNNISLIILSLLGAINQSGLPSISLNKRYVGLLKMLQYMEEHISEPMSLKDIAASSEVSPREALNSFSDFFEVSPMQFLKKKRLLLVANELKNSTNLDLNSLKNKYGFCTTSYLIETFKNLFGETPKNYCSRVNITKWSNNALSLLDDI